MQYSVAARSPLAQGLHTYYLSAFTPDAYALPETIENAFTAAAFLANQARMFGEDSARSLLVAYDLGADTQVPAISTVGIVVVSCAQGLFLIVLLVTAVYAWMTPTWTTVLDAFAVLRMGAAVGGPLRPEDGRHASTSGALLFASDPGKLRVLDETPGWVGDVSHGANGAGQLWLGRGDRFARATSRRQYRCFER
ncbi:hypothetical protein MKEN_01301900 [Mycena kentingensis (nom. inval.)]|nr:hypothetical protein MKEN_01301900 [Mycena kentingensis (nom. inval.)]